MMNVKHSEVAETSPRGINRPNSLDLKGSSHSKERAKAKVYNNN